MLSSILKRVDPFAVLAVTLPLAIYLLTLAPSVTFFDSGEFITAIHSLGTAHSPGYPFFVNYAKPFTWLPFGNIAFRVNIATAVSAAAACYGAYLLVLAMLPCGDADGAAMPRYVARGCALAAALAFAFSARLWLQSNHDKPYPLVSFIVAVVFWALLRFRARYDEGEECPHYVYLGAFLCGLATGAHQTIVLMLPAFAWLIISKDWRLLGRVKEFVIAVAFGLLGFAIQLHMPIRALKNPLLNWGDPRTLDQFLWNLLRKGYPSEPPVRDLALLWQQTSAFNVPLEFTWVGVGFLTLGLAVSLRRRRDEVIAYLLGVVTSLLVIVGYFNTPSDLIFLTEEFFTPLYLLSAVFIGVGLFWLLRRALDSIQVEKLTSMPIKVLVLVFTLMLPGTICALNYYENDQHDNYVAFDYATNTFRSLPQYTALFTWGDSGAFPLWYLQGVERMREDLDLLHTPHLVFRWYLDAFPHLFSQSMLRAVPESAQSAESALKMAVAEQIGRRPVFIDFSTRYSLPFAEYGMQQRGIAYHLIQGGKDTVYPPDLSVWGLYSSRGYTSQMGFRDLDTGKAILIYAMARLEGGETLLRTGYRAQGAEELRLAAAIAPELRGQVEQMLGTYGVR
ncbi:DUF2723 domain-containing protein [Geobacter hydrogenophilus]|uniref:Membrane protein n=1 Tax=Geobacter hydrogenophilus TaxID=40983 RepID=A0A9W6FX28_9BACT|nr:DUF2723 domain-containing protein [Geobacter hydrogenophilus]MBT0895198.1 DUF2723 domain-containing protein [Geobacter hydrogenophilus]GLI36620.1 membrane protein [Geobacter hydrogenophilus]